MEELALARFQQTQWAAEHPTLRDRGTSPAGGPISGVAHSPAYEIRPVRSGDFPQLAELLRHLTGADPSWNRDYLRWKYLDNPFVERPLGIVAAAGQEIVGFRGYHATPWHVPASGYHTRVLSPGDTCVHPEHRRSGLSVKMGRLAMRELEPDYRVFLNMTAGASSVPGYLRMGFVPLQDKSRMSLTRPLQWARAFFRSRGFLRGRGRSLLTGVDFGEYGDIEVAPEALPQEMARVAMHDSSSEVRLIALQDERFFRWRFSAPRANHVFCYARERGRVAGYVVLQVVASGQIATITDYSRQSFSAVEHILRFLARSGPFGLIWIYSFTPEPELRPLLRKLGFREDRLLERVRRRMNRVWPLLVRPVKADPEEEDWFVEGLDIRAISSWEIREIRSDAI